jgi:hypothetical protein
MSDDYREFTNSNGHTWGEFKLDPVVAQRIKELRLGLNGSPVCSWRVIAIRVTGHEDQMTGSELCRLAQWTLGEEWDE